jgi:metallo-beta-lactamase class B
MRKAKLILSLFLLGLMVALSAGNRVFGAKRAEDGETPPEAQGKNSPLQGKSRFLATLGMTSVRMGGGAQAKAIAGAALPQNNAEWTEAFPAHRVVGNVYYVGSRGLASYLITTPRGHILINSSMESNVQMIGESIESLGFHFVDVKILLISHAHWDHCAGSARLKELTSVKYMVMDADVPVVESGGKEDFQYGNSPDNLYKPAKVDRVLHDGDEVKLAGVVLVAHKTPGHTKGCTTWTMKVRDVGKTYNVVIVGSPNVNPGYKLVNNARYPQIAQDYEQTFAC